MIHFNFSESEQTEREYIKSVIETSKQDFNNALGRAFFKDDNLKVAFCNFEHRATIYEAFCQEFFPLYLADCYSRTDTFTAQAFTNIENGIYGIMICLGTDHVPREWYKIILHEMCHVFCIVYELGGDNFTDKYSKINMGDTPQHRNISAGYAIWREFIADYIAFHCNPWTHPPLTDLRKAIRELDEEVNVSNPDSTRNCAQILTYIFLDPKVYTAKDDTAVFQFLEKNRIFATKERSGDYHRVISLIFEQLKRKDCWIIDPEFIEELGKTYLWQLVLNDI